MNSTTPAARGVGMDVSVFNVGGLLSRLEELTDTRSPKGMRYALAPVLVLIILAKLSGEDKPYGIADWIKSRGQVLREAFHLCWRSMPQHNTVRRIMEHVAVPEELDRVFGEYLQSLSGVGRSLLIAVDGKTVRGTIDAESPDGDHLLAAYLPEEGIVLMQVATGGKGKEIKAAPELLKCVDLRGKVVAGDAIQVKSHRPCKIVGIAVWAAVRASFCFDAGFSETARLCRFRYSS